MKIFNFVILLYVIYGCMPSIDKISGIEIDSHADLINPDGDLKLLKNKAKLLWYKDYELYIKNKITSQLDSNDQLIKKDTIRNYFLRKRGLKYGILYNSISKKKEKYHADSIWNKFDLYNTSKQKFDLNTNYKPEIIRNHHILIEKYKLNVKDYNLDSCYLYYNNQLLDIPFKISEGLDTKLNYKLFKIEFIVNKMPNGEPTSKYPIPRRVYYHQFKKLNDYECEMYLFLFKQFEQDIKNLQLN